MSHCRHGALGSEVPGVRSLQEALLLPGSRASLIILHREEAAVQRHGVTAGREVHRCLGAVGRLQREREVLCLVWRCYTHRAGLLSQRQEGYLSNRSASARVLGLVGTSTYNHGSDPEYN